MTGRRRRKGHPAPARIGRAPLGAAVTRAARLGRWSSLDAEVAIFDQQLRSRFDWLRDPDPDAVASPPLLMTFDVMYRDGRDLSAQSLRDRRALLEDAVAGSELIFPVRRLAANGIEAWQQVLERGYEGYVAKDEASKYVGGRTRSWLKVKQPGWTDAEDRWKGFGRRPVTAVLDQRLPEQRRRGSG